jgi:hypothetical protein
MDLQWEKSPHLEAHYEGQEKTSKRGLQRPRRAPTKQDNEGQEKHQQRKTTKAKKNLIEGGLQRPRRT